MAKYEVTLRWHEQTVFIEADSEEQAIDRAVRGYHGEPEMDEPDIHKIV